MTQLFLLLFSPEVLLLMTMRHRLP